jgi:hypothetical protein
MVLLINFFRAILGVEQTNATADQTQANASPGSLPSKDDIKFNEPDSENNIIFMDQKELKTLQSELDPSAAVVHANEIPQIKGASIYKLIERASTEKYAGS